MRKVKTGAGDGGAMSRLFALLALPLLLAGCAEDVTPAAAPAETEVVLVTAENDIESLSNDSFSMAAHQHDYWGGKQRLTILEQTVPAGTLWFGGAWAFAFVPEDGVVVPQGTSRVEITVSWIDGTNRYYADPEVWVRTAADHESWFVADAVSGETLAVETSLGQLDLPHQSISAWRIEWRVQPGLLPVDGGRGVWWDGELSVLVEAIAGAEIPVYPAHPDKWGGAETIELFADETETGMWFGHVDEWSCIRSCPVRHRPVNGTVVPYDAAMVEVVLELGADNPTDLGVKLHGADSRAWTELDAVEVDGKRQRFLVPVVPGMGDSPYASQSVWEFAVYVAGPERDSVEIGSYTLTARALRVAVE